MNGTAAPTTTETVDLAQAIEATEQFVLAATAGAVFAKYASAMFAGELDGAF